MTKINLHEMMAARMNELAKEYQNVCDKNSYRLAGRKANAMEALMSEDAFADGYTAALSDLQGKVDGLLNALEHMTKFNWPGSSAAEFASDALAEFKNGGAE